MDSFEENLKTLLNVYSKEFKDGNIEKIYEEVTAQYSIGSNKVNQQKVMNQALFKCGYTAEDIIAKCGRTYRYMFAECNCLEKITIENIEEIAFGAFYQCYNLQEVKIGKGITNIIMDAFRMCFNLKTLYLSSAVKYIDCNAFSGCVSLKEIFFDGTAEDWDNIDGSKCMFEKLHTLDKTKPIKIHLLKSGEVLEYNYD